tara:strand:- start:362 stop:700 length:339 start_codon:yes stop_codon:yes gene_type:complete
MEEIPHIEVTIYILPNLNTDTQEIFNKLSSEFKLFEYSTEMFDNIIYFHYKLNLNENRYQFEDFLDYLCGEYEKLRYIIKIYLPNKKYPESVRINKLFKKIKTINQTKYIGF